MKYLKLFENFKDFNYLDPRQDLQANFKEWRTGHYQKEKTDELLNTMKNRHPNIDPKELQQLVYNWTECDWTEDQQP